jgi:hypothetical protein
MTTVDSRQPSQREVLSELPSRLNRVRAAGDSIVSLTAVPGTSNSMLTNALQSLEHDQVRAAQAAESVRERIRS